MVSIDATVFILIVNFLVLIFALNIVLYKPIRGILLQRKAKVEGLEKGINAATDGANEKNQAFLKGIKDARAKGQKEKEALLLAAAEEEKQIVGKINAKAQEELSAVKAKIASDTDAVRETLQKEVDSFAEAISQKILGRAV